MKLSERWLRAWIDPPIDSAALADQLTSLGLEVDSVTAARPDFDAVVVARIEAVRAHPNADRLRVCTVDAGEGEPLEVVCGAPNAREGLVTALATVGGRLPDGTRVRKATLRGVESRGMLCSAAELGLSDAADGIVELAADAPPGTDLGAWLGLDDAIIDVDLTPDRGDCLSVRGLARELSAKNDLPLSASAVEPYAPAIDERLGVAIEPDSACARFTGRVVRGLDMGRAVPPAVVERLRRSGVRSINPAVDVTNHVMLELGQPMHAFDLAKLRGPIRVRLARAGERLTLLDGRDVALEPDTTVIADDSGPVALAGIMGGIGTAVDGTTREVFLESALFLPSDLVGKPRRYAANTESSHRFERGVDPEGQREALEAATRLLVEIAGGEAGPVIEERVETRLPERPELQLRAARLARVLGVEIPPDEVERIFARLGIACERLEDADGAGWRLLPPSHRWDLAIEEDFVEEIGRVHGYDALPRTLPRQRSDFRARPETRVSPLALKRLLAHRGYREVVTYSFVDGRRQALLRPDLPALALANPISSELDVMRTTLVGGLLEVYRRNASRGIESMRLFETGLRFLPGADEGGRAAPDAYIASGHGDDIQLDASLAQQRMLAGLAVGRREDEGWNSADAPLDFYAVKADLEALFAEADAVAPRFLPSTLAMLHPGRAATILAGELPVGYLGALNPELERALDLPAAPWVFELSLAALAEARLPEAVAPSRYPAIRRDIALVVDETVDFEALVATVRRHAPPTLRDVRLFDVYRGGNLEKGRKSMALGLILQDFSRTLDESDAESAVARLVEALGREHGATLRD